MNKHFTSNFCFTGRYRLLLIFIFGFISCENEEQFSHPVVHTGEVTEITSDGAVFHGQVANSSGVEIIDHGFVWDTEPEPGINYTLKHSLGPLKGKSFNAKVQSGFKKDIEYYMRAFIQTNDAIIYGRRVIFISQGGLPITVASIEPSEAFFGDTIKISGYNFKAKQEDINVMFNDKPATIIYNSDETIKVIVPKELDNVTSQINLTIYSQSATLNEPFSLLPPLIKSIEPDIGWNHTIVELKGKGFHIEKSRNKVLIDDIEHEVISSTNQRISFKPRFSVPHGKHSIKVETLGQIGISQEHFQKMEPWKMLDNPPFETNSKGGFSIGGRIFAGNIANRELFEYIPTENQWVKKGLTPSGNSYINRRNQLFSTNDFGYLIAQPYNTQTCRLHIYNTENDHWTAKAEYPGKIVPYQTGFTIGNDLYFGIGLPNNINLSTEFWKYSYDEDTWSQLNDFPFEGSKLTGFSHNNKGYMLGYHRTISKYGISEYTHETDSWEFILDLDSFSFNATILVPLKESFLILNGDGGSHREVYEFLPASNQFIKRQEINIPYSFSTKFYFYTNTLTFLGGTGAPESYFWQFNQSVSWE